MESALIVIGIGLALIVGGIVGLVMAFLAARKVRVITATRTSRLSDLIPQFEAVRAELGGDASEMHQTAELKGVVECDAPVTGELSQKPAAMVHTRVSRKVEVLRQSTDKHGNTRQRWVQQTEHVHSNEVEAPFYLNDGSGRIRVRPAGASLDLTEVVDRFEQAGAVEQSSGRIALGSFSFSFSTPLGSSKRTLGYRFEESILPLGAELYVLGDISDTGDGLAVRDPDRDGRPYIVSTKGEEALVRSGRSTAKWGKIGGGAAICIGIATGAVGLIMLIF